MKQHKPIKKWHVPFTSKKLIDTIGTQLNCDTWHLKKKKITQLLLPMNDPYGRGGNWWCIKNARLASSKKGVREKELKRLDMRNMLLLNYLIRPW